MNLAEHARIWIFQSKRPFNTQEIKTITNKFDEFLKDWNAHGAALLADYQIIDNQFVVVGVDEDQAAASGCSIDKLTKLIRTIEEEYQFGFLDRMNAAYQQADTLNIVQLNDFKNMVKNGELPDSVIVYNNGLTDLKSFREAWKLPLKESWAKNLISTS
ncbi:ABC transporter ATPase [Vaginella massiliensis]|uniref:hypothetical protein n=1 Tax=Vaginella massiliensis TaxID=1816680 RepID=UPI0008387A2F|nr:hypothetical protein [Vaginella massiliensis]